MGADINNTNNMGMNNKIKIYLSMYLGRLIYLYLSKYVYPLVLLAQVFLSFELG